MIALLEKDTQSDVKNDRHQAIGYFSELSEILCLKLSESLDKLKVIGVEREKLLIYLNFLATKDIKTAEHSIRVALLCEQIADELKVDAKGLFYSGLLHDMGKALIPLDVLKKTEGFNKDDMEVMKEHPLNTFKLIGDIFGFSANVGLRHHKHQTNGYPSDLPTAKQPFSEMTMLDIDHFSKILSIADFFDAAVSRKDSKFGKGEPLTLEEAFEVMVEKNPDDKDLIDYFRKSGAFKRHLKLI